MYKLLLSFRVLDIRSFIYKYLTLQLFISHSEKYIKLFNLHFLPNALQLKNTNNYELSSETLS